MEDVYNKNKRERTHGTVKGSLMIFIVVAICKTDTEVLQADAQYVYDNRVKYWSP